MGKCFSQEEKLQNESTKPLEQQRLSTESSHYSKSECFTDKFIYYYKNSSSMKKHKENQIGLYMDQSIGESKLQNFKQWMDHIDQYWITKSLYRVNEPFPTQRNKSNVKTSASEAFISEFGLSNCSQEVTPETNPDEDRVLIELYGAINIFARKDPKRFNEVLSQKGGGIIRWGLWRARLLNEVRHQKQYLKINDEYLVPRDDIERDIERTFPDKKVLSQKNFLKSLSILLNKTCFVFQDLGYCQGMNFVLCFMLMNAGGNQKDAWKCIFSFFYCYQWMLYGIYMVEFPLLQMLAKLTRKILEKKEQKLYQKIEQLEIDDSFLVNKWILTLYLYNTSTKTVLTFWDEILAKGIFIISSINAALLKKMENIIMKCQDQFEFLDFVQNLNQDERLFGDHNQIQKLALNNYMFDIYDIIDCSQELYLKCQHPDSREFLLLFRHYKDQIKFKIEYEQFLANRMRQMPQI